MNNRTFDLHPDLLFHDRGQLPTDQFPSQSARGYDVLANRPPLEFKEGLFWKTCNALGLNNAWERSVWKAQMLVITSVQEMLQLIGEDFRSHFSKMYAFFSLRNA